MGPAPGTPIASNWTRRARPGPIGSGSPVGPSAAPLVASRPGGARPSDTNSVPHPVTRTFAAPFETRSSPAPRATSPRTYRLQGPPRRCSGGRAACRSSWPVKTPPSTPTAATPRVTPTSHPATSQVRRSTWNTRAAVGGCLRLQKEQAAALASRQRRCRLLRQVPLRTARREVHHRPTRHRWYQPWHPSSGGETDSELGTTPLAGSSAKTTTGGTRAPSPAKPGRLAVIACSTWNTAA